MKTIKLSGLIALTVLLLSSCVHLGDLNLDPIPDIAFSVEHNGLTLTFASTSANTSDVKWKTSDGGAESGETMTHTFPEPGTYWIEMSGTYEGVPQTVSTKILVAKPAKVSMTDGTVADWEKVTYPDFQLTGAEPGSPIQKVKIDYDANYVYYYMELDVTANPAADEYSHILSVRIDSDDDTSTGMSTGGVGADYLMEGNVYEGGWYDFYKYSAADDDWSYIEDADFYEKGIVIGHRVVTDNIMKVEWAYSRSIFGITYTSYSFYMKAYDGDWSDADIVYFNGSKTIHIAMDKKQ